MGPHGTRGNNKELIMLFDHVLKALQEKDTPPYVEIDGHEVDLETLKPRSITLREYLTIRANHAGFRALYPYLDNECLAYVADYVAKNCAPRFVETYDWALSNVVVPELISRLEDKPENTGDDKKAREELKWLGTLRPEDEWYDDIGPVLWWKVPIEEPPYCGTPLDSGWPGYHTHWSPLPVVSWNESDG